MKRFDADVGAMNTPFQKRPEILKRVRVNDTINVSDGVVDNFVGVLPFKSVIRAKVITVERCSRFDVILDFFLERILSAIWNHKRPHSSAALNDSHNCGFVCSARSGDSASPLRDVHIPRLTTDEGFIDFDFTVELSKKRSGLHGLPNAVIHEPRRFLRHSDCPRNLVRTNAVLAIRNHPRDGEPFVESKWRIFKDASDLNTELPMMVDALALPLALTRQEHRVFAVTRRADHAIGPTSCNQIAEAVVGVGKVDDCFL